jgi:peptidylprolyl isomerase
LTVGLSLLLAVPTIACQSRSAEPVQDNGKEKEKKQPKSLTKTDSGLQFLDVKEGTGEPPKPGHTCVVHYTYWLWDQEAKGKKIDSSRDRDVPFTFHVANEEVIKGWDEGLSNMKTGGKRELIVPPELAWGERGAGGVIPPNATLFFEVELLEIWEKTDSGLEYFDIKEGTGAEPRAGQTCVMHYTGWLWRANSKAKKFDSSVDRDEPFSFPIGRGKVIKGWDEGIASMRVGGKRKLLIPAKLGYGEDGFGDDIPPNSTLYFEVELLKLK